MIVSYKCPIIGKQVSSGHTFYVIVNHIIEKLTSVSHVVSHVTVLILIIEFRHNIVKVAMDLRTADYLDNVMTNSLSLAGQTQAVPKK